MSSWWTKLRGYFSPRQAKTAPGRGERSMPLSETLTLGESGKPVRSSWSEETAAAEALKVSGWVFVCAALRCDAVASLPIKLQVRRGDEWEDAAPASHRSAAKHPLLQLLEQPNGDMTRAEFLQRCVLSLDFGGNMIVTKGRGLGPDFQMDQVVKLWPISSDVLRPVPVREEGGVAYYEKVTSPGYGRRYELEEVIHLQAFPDPTNPYWGMSRMEAAGFASDATVAASQYNFKMFSNGHFPSGLITFDGTPTQEQLVQVRTQFESRYGGSGNAGKIAIFGRNAKYQPFAMDAAKLQVIEGLKLSRSEVFATFGVPPVLAGDFERATYNNTREALKIFWTMTALPLAKQVFGGLQRGLAADFGEDVRVWFDTSHIDVLQDLSVEQVEKAEGLSRLGVPMVEVNRRLRLGLSEEAIQEDDGAGLLPVEKLQQARLGLDLLHTPSTAKWAAEMLGMDEPTPEQMDDYWLKKHGGAAAPDNVVPLRADDQEKTA